MDDYIAIVKYEPALVGLSLDASFFLMFLFGGFQYTFREGVQHTVAGAVANYEIICKRRDVFDVKQQDVFTLSILQGIDDFMCKFECVQISPLFIFSRRH
jgi:hypothetical protein